MAQKADEQIQAGLNYREELEERLKIACEALESIKGATSSKYLSMQHAVDDHKIISIIALNKFKREEYMTSEELLRLRNNVLMAQVEILTNALEEADRRFRAIQEKTISDPSGECELRARAQSVYVLADTGYKNTSIALAEIAQLSDGEK